MRNSRRCVNALLIALVAYNATVQMFAADRQMVKGLLSNSYHTNLFNHTYQCLKNRVEWDGYARTALQNEYPGMYIRDASLQCMAHIGEGDLSDARSILSYMVRYCRAKGYQRAPHYIFKVDRDSAGNPNNYSSYSQPDHPNTLGIINSPRYRMAQTFIPALSGHVQGIEVFLAMPYDSPGTLHVSLQTSLTGGVILGTATASAREINRVSLVNASDQGWVRFDFVPTVAVSGGTTYYIVLYATDVLPPVTWCGKVNATAGRWGPAYSFDTQGNGWTALASNTIAAFVVDDFEGRYRNYRDGSIADQPDGNYFFIHAWLDYVETSGDTAFRDLTYDVIANFANYYLTTRYFNASPWSLLENPALESAREERFWRCYDLCTNGVAAHALKNLSAIAQAKGDTANAAKWHQYFLAISSGIENRLSGDFDGKQIYFDRYDIDNNYRLWKGFADINLAPFWTRRDGMWNGYDPLKMKNTYDAYIASGSFIWVGKGSDAGRDYHVLILSTDPRNPDINTMIGGSLLGWESYYAGTIGYYHRIVDNLNWLEWYNRSNNLLPEAARWSAYNAGQTWKWGFGNQIMVGAYIHSMRKLRDVLYPPIRIACVSEPSDVVADGRGEATATATVYNELNEIAINSTATVSFAIAGPGTLVGNPSVPVRLGQARISVRAGSVPGTITVTAQSPGLVSGGCSINTFLGSPPARISVSAQPESMRADGKSISVISAALQDTSGRIINTATHPVTFALNGPGMIIGQNPAVPVNGVAVVSIVASTVPGTAMVTASAAGIGSDSKVIVMQPCGALWFDGINDAVRIPASASLNYSGNSITLEAWIQNHSPGDWNSRAIICREDNQVGLWGYGYPEYHFVLVINGVRQDLQMNLPQIWPKLAWTHLAGTYDGSTMRLFFNGTLMASKTVSGMLTPASAQWGIGGSGGWYWFGAIDEVRVSRSCRYTNDFVVPDSPFTVDAETVALWHLDEGMGTSARDTTNNRNDGTLVNGPQWITGCDFPRYNTPIPGTATAIAMSAVPSTIPADGASTARVTAMVVDGAGILVNNSSATVLFGLSGAGVLVGSPSVTAVGGIATITYRSGTTTGTVLITAQSHGLRSGSAAIAVVSSHTTNNPPVVSMLSPLPGTTFFAPATITLEATAFDDGAVSSVEFYSGHTRIAVDSTSPYQYLWTVVSSGTYQLRAVAYDNGTPVLTATSTVVSITVIASHSVYCALITTAVPPSGGMVVPSSGMFLRGSTVTITAVPAEGFWFSAWGGDLSGSQNPVSIIMTSTKNIVATFSVIPTTGIYYSLSVGVYPVVGGLVTAYPPHGPYLAGTTVTVSAIPNPGYRFSGWVGDIEASSTTNPIVVVMNSTKAITAYFDAVSPVDAPPTTALLRPSSSTVFTAPAVIDLSATASDDYGVSKVEFYVNNALLATIMSSPYEYRWSPVEVGTYTITAVAYDTIGQNSTSCAIRVFVVDPIHVSMGELKVVGGVQGYMNPDRNESARFVFRAPRQGIVQVSIYTLQGTKVFETAMEATPQEVCSVRWRGRTSDETIVASGVYIVTVKVQVWMRRKNSSLLDSCRYLGNT